MLQVSAVGPEALPPFLTSCLAALLWLQLACACPSAANAWNHSTLHGVNTGGSPLCAACSTKSVNDAQFPAAESIFAVSAAQDDAGINYRFTSISFAGDEVSVVSFVTVCGAAAAHRANIRVTAEQYFLAGHQASAHGQLHKSHCSYLLSTETPMQATRPQNRYAVLRQG